MANDKHRGVNYWDLKSSLALGSVYYHALVANFDPSENSTTNKFALQTAQEEYDDPNPSASTDQGNVSYELPTYVCRFNVWEERN
jgi:hypothetical protein